MAGELVNVLTGLNHTNADHNILFSYQEASGGNVSAAFIGVTSATVTLPLDLSSDTTTTSRRLPDDESSLMTSVENQDLAGHLSIGATIIGGPLSTTMDLKEETFFENIRKIFRKDMVANSVIEKRAYYVKAQVEGKKNIEYSYPAVVCRGQDVYKSAETLFCGKTLDKLELELTALKIVLESKCP